jgi:hypothetical protein
MLLSLRALLVSGYRFGKGFSSSLTSRKQSPVYIKERIFPVRDKGDVPLLDIGKASCWSLLKRISSRKTMVWTPFVLVLPPESPSGFHRARSLLHSAFEMGSFRAIARRCLPCSGRSRGRIDVIRSASDRILQHLPDRETNSPLLRYIHKRLTHA